MKTKRVSNRMVALLMFLAGAMITSAQVVTVDGLSFYLDETGHEAVVVDVNTCSGELNIPSEISNNGQTFIVTGMVWNAFFDCHELTKVRIPKTLDHVVHHALSDNNTVVGGAAGATASAVSPYLMNPFVGCTALAAVEVDKDNPNMSSSDGILFSKDKSQLYCYPAGLQAASYVVPEDVTWVGDNAFAGNVSLTFVQFPVHLKNLPGGIFDGCLQLKEVNLPDGLVHIGAFSFRNCSSLQHIEIPATVTHIGEYAFMGCSSLASVVINGVINAQYGTGDVFSGLDSLAIIYVLPTELERYQQWYKGQVLPLGTYAYDSTVGIATPPSRPCRSAASPLFDLQGRRFSVQPQRGVYIQDGRKKVAK